MATSVAFILILFSDGDFYLISFTSVFFPKERGVESSRMFFHEIVKMLHALSNGVPSPMHLVLLAHTVMTLDARKDPGN